ETTGVGRRAGASRTAWLWQGLRGAASSGTTPAAAQGPEGPDPAGPAGDQATAPDEATARDRALIDDRLSRMPPQRPGQVDLFALAVAGDGRENVVRNEAAYFEDLATARHGA